MTPSFAHAVERVGHDLADLAVVVGGDGGDGFDVVLAAIFFDCFLRFSMTASTALRTPRAMAIASVPAVSDR
jgi:hypothetical protein